MAFTDYLKETSEKSDSNNWAKKALIESGDFYFESIEGCSQNDKNVTTLIMERACVKCRDGIKSNETEVLSDIILLEGKESLQRKINFANLLGLPLSYVLYCYESRRVWRYEIKSINSIALISEYSDFESFSDWIQSEKEWISTKPFEGIKSLPQFDIDLRNRGCAWPTNIDCIVFSKENTPLAILEFQNADKTSVRNHNSNLFFLFGKIKNIEESGNVKYREDVRRYLSQEILRVQTGLRFLILTWRKNDSDFRINEVEKIVFPNIPHGKGSYTESQKMKAIFNGVFTNDSYNIRNNNWNYIISNFSSYSLENSGGVINEVPYSPPLSTKDKTAPSLYYKFCHIGFEQKEKLPSLFYFILNKYFE